MRAFPPLFPANEEGLRRLICWTHTDAFKDYDPVEFGWNTLFWILMAAQMAYQSKRRSVTATLEKIVDVPPEELRLRRLTYRWHLYYRRQKVLITVNGEADNGKDYVADWLAKRFNLVKIALADPMKRFTRHLFGVSQENLWGPSQKRNEELDAVPLWNRAFSQIHTLHLFTAAVVPEKLGYETRARAFDSLQTWFTGLRKQYREKISARTILQTLGTEWGRSVSPTVWTDYLFDVQLPLLAEGFLYEPDLGIMSSTGEPKSGVVIPDQRFTNELEASEARGGYSIRVRRLSRVKTDNSNVGIQGHQSEQEQRGIPDARFKKVFNFEEGLDKVDAALEEWAQEYFALLDEGVRELFTRPRDGG